MDIVKSFPKKKICLIFNFVVILGINFTKMKELDFFRTRRTIRNYTNVPIPDELLIELLEAASHAPTTGNMQLYSVVVTRDEESKRALSPSHFNQPSVMGCNVLLTFCADFNRFVKWCELRNAAPGYDNFQSFITALLDVTIFAQQFCMLAEMAGLGCCYLGTTTYNAPQIAEHLQLPDRVVPVITLTVGYPADESKISDRLPVSAIVHNERYKNYSVDDINIMYQEKENLADSKRFIAENGKETLAQVFTDIRYTKANNEAFSKIYRDFIVDKKFDI